MTDILPITRDELREVVERVWPTVIVHLGLHRDARPDVAVIDARGSILVEGPDRGDLRCRARLRLHDLLEVEHYLVVQRETVEGYELLSVQGWAATETSIKLGDLPPNDLARRIWDARVLAEQAARAQALEGPALVGRREGAILRARTERQAGGR